VLLRINVQYGAFSKEHAGTSGMDYVAQFAL